MKVYLIVREDCSAYGTMGGDHCHFSVEEIYLDQKKAEHRYSWYEKKAFAGRKP